MYTPCITGIHGVEASRLVFQILGQVYMYMEQRPPGWFFRYWVRYTRSRGLQMGFPGTGRDIPGQRPPDWFWNKYKWRRGLQIGSGTGIPGAEGPDWF